MPVPMTPEGEFEIPTTLVEEMLAEMGEAEKEMEVEAMKIKQWLEDEMINSGVTPATEMNEGGECRMLEEGSLRDRMERMNDRVRGWFGLAAVERTPLCSSLWPGAEAEMMETIVRGKKMLAPPLPIDLPLPSSLPLHVVEGSVNVAAEESPRMPCHQGATRPIDVDEARAIPVNRPMRTSVWIHHLHRQRMRQSTFWGRLQRALYALSPWEGRALAFVVGCGLGVLVRMIYVFIVIGVRMWRREQKKRAEGQVHLSGDEEDGDGEIVGVVLFDAASIKGSSSQDDLPLYTEKE
ncbi:hypothetical protein FRC16_009284 [Serendipita sp. 398]|nr:hypothetical protein FRC16_009284 [Serendipita sp. 398]